MEQDLPLLGLDEADQAAGEGGFARPRLADQAELTAGVTLPPPKLICRV
jgi:hypothetical protein